MLADADHTIANRLTDAGLSVRDAAPSYLEDMRGNLRGHGTYVALPQSTKDVATCVSICNDARVGIVPFAGGTGLVGGHIALDGPLPLILSLERLTAIRATYPEEYTLIAEAGITLSDVQIAAQQENRLFPLSYASQDTARIGGALAVNSGGLNVLRYGVARDLCLGVEAVLPNGDVFHGLKRLRKDNTGYDLRNLLIGSEGTLGIITAAALKLHPVPGSIATAFLSVENPAAALTLLGLFKERAGNAVSAFELIPEQSFLFLSEVFPDMRQPFATPPPWSVLVELGTVASTDAETVLSETFEVAASQGLVHDGQIAQSGQQRDAFWALREAIPAANKRVGAIASHDISLPLGEVPDFMIAARSAILSKLPDARINGFGHLGDGNLHYNIFPPLGVARDAYMHLSAELTALVHDLAIERDGSFSAEHGIGRLKSAELQRRSDPAKLAAMQAIKAALDPLGIMNPGAVLK